MHETATRHALKRTIGTAALLAALLAPPAAAQVPLQVPYVGELTTADGAPFDGVVDVVASLHSAESGGAVLWGPVDFGTVPVSGGVFAVVLGDALSPVDAATLAGGQVWLEIALDGTVMAPRQQVLAAPFAVLASDAERLGGVPASTFATADSLHPLATGGVELSASAPPGPADGQLWFDPTTGTLSVAEGGGWSPVSGGETGSNGSADLEQVSGGLLTTSFAGSWGVPGGPVPIQDSNTIGVDSELIIGEAGDLLGVTVRAELVHPDLEELRITLFAPNPSDPANPLEFTLYDGSQTGACQPPDDPTVDPCADPEDCEVTLEWPPEPLAAGSFDTLMGLNPSGTWRLHVTDFCTSVNGGVPLTQVLSSWRVDYEVARPDELGVSATLNLQGGVVTNDGRFQSGEATLAEGESLTVTLPLSASHLTTQVWFQGQQSGAWYTGDNYGDTLVPVDTGDGSDGAFEPTSDVALEGGSYQFTRFVVPAGVTVTVTGDEPLVVRSLAPIRIDGTLMLAGGAGTSGDSGIGTGGDGGEGRAGGGDGGAGGGPGAGTGGIHGANSGGGCYGHFGAGGAAGHATDGVDSPPLQCSFCNGPGEEGPGYDSLNVGQLVGGSGGGGGACGDGTKFGGAGGGAGGGAVQLVAPRIDVGGTIDARGGAGGSSYSFGGAGGGGSGGAIWLVSDRVDASGGSLLASGGAGGVPAQQQPNSCVASAGASGRIRVDAVEWAPGSVSPAPALNLAERIGDGFRTFVSGDDPSEITVVNLHPFPVTVRLVAIGAPTVEGAPQ